MINMYVFFFIRKKYVKITPYWSEIFPLEMRGFWNRFCTEFFFLHYTVYLWRNHRFERYFFHVIWKKSSRNFIYVLLYRFYIQNRILENNFLCNFMSNKNVVSKILINSYHFVLYVIRIFFFLHQKTHRYLYFNIK